MIEIVQTGQFGKTELLFDMHRLRARVFKERMGWDVSVDLNGLEVDNYDLPETIYILSLNDSRRVIGIWRVLPTSGPTMIRDIWPQFLSSLPMPASDTVWEASRFAVHSFAEDAEVAKQEAKQAIGELFCGLTELCIEAGIKEVFTLYDARIARVIRRLNCQPYALSQKLPVDGISTQIGAFRTDNTMLTNIRAATGIKNSLIKGISLPPALAAPTGKIRMSGFSSPAFNAQFGVATQR